MNERAGYGRVELRDTAGVKRCWTCKLTMPDSPWPSCFSCTFPEIDGEGEAQRRRRIAAALADS